MQRNRTTRNPCVRCCIATAIVVVSFVAVVHLGWGPLLSVSPSAREWQQCFASLGAGAAPSNATCDDYVGGGMLARARDAACTMCSSAADEALWELGAQTSAVGYGMVTTPGHHTSMVVHRRSIKSFKALTSSKQQLCTDSGYRSWFSKNSPVWRERLLLQVARGVTYRAVPGLQKPESLGSTLNGLVHAAQAVAVLGEPLRGALVLLGDRHAVPPVEQALWEMAVGAHVGGSDASGATLAPSAPRVVRSFAGIIAADMRVGLTASRPSVLSSAAAGPGRAPCASPVIRNLTAAVRAGHAAMHPASSNPLGGRRTVVLAASAAQRFAEASVFLRALRAELGDELDVRVVDLGAASAVEAVGLVASACSAIVAGSAHALAYTAFLPLRHGSGGAAGPSVVFATAEANDLATPDVDIAARFVRLAGMQLTTFVLDGRGDALPPAAPGDDALKPDDGHGAAAGDREGLHRGSAETGGEPAGAMPWADSDAAAMAAAVRRGCAS